MKKILSFRVREPYSVSLGTRLAHIQPSELDWLHAIYQQSHSHPLVLSFLELPWLSFLAFTFDSLARIPRSSFEEPIVTKAAFLRKIDSFNELFDEDNPVDQTIKTLLSSFSGIRRIDQFDRVKKDLTRLCDIGIPLLFSFRGWVSDLKTCFPDCLAPTDTLSKESSWRHLNPHLSDMDHGLGSLLIFLLQRLYVSMTPSGVPVPGEIQLLEVDEAGCRPVTAFKDVPIRTQNALFGFLNAISQLHLEQQKIASSMPFSADEFCIRHGIDETVTIQLSGVDNSLEFAIQEVAHSKADLGFTPKRASFLWGWVQSPVDPLETAARADILMLFHLLDSPFGITSERISKGLDWMLAQNNRAKAMLATFSHAPFKRDIDRLDRLFFDHHSLTDGGAHSAVVEHGGTSVWGWLCCRRPKAASVSYPGPDPNHFGRLPVLVHLASSEFRTSHNIRQVQSVSQHILSEEDQALKEVMSRFSQSEYQVLLTEMRYLVGLKSWVSYLRKEVGKLDFGPKLSTQLLAIDHDDIRKIDSHFDERYQTSISARTQILGVFDNTRERILSSPISDVLLLRGIQSILRNISSELSSDGLFAAVIAHIHTEVEKFKGYEDEIRKVCFIKSGLDHFAPWVLPKALSVVSYSAGRQYEPLAGSLFRDVVSMLPLSPLHSGVSNRSVRQNLEHMATDRRTYIEIKNELMLSSMIGSVGARVAFEGYLGTPFTVASIATDLGLAAISRPLSFLLGDALYYSYLSDLNRLGQSLSFIRFRSPTSIVRWGEELIYYRLTSLSMKMVYSGLSELPIGIDQFGLQSWRMMLDQGLGLMASSRVTGILRDTFGQDFRQLNDRVKLSWNDFNGGIDILKTQIAGRPACILHPDLCESAIIRAWEPFVSETPGRNITLFMKQTRKAMLDLHPDKVHSDRFGVLDGVCAYPLDRPTLDVSLLLTARASAAELQNTGYFG